MLKKICLTLLCASSLLSATAIGMTHELAPTLSLEYDLVPNRPELFINYTIFNVKASCDIDTPDKENVIHVRGINRTGSINGQIIRAGDELDIIVHKGDQMELSAQSVAKVELTNKGTHSLKAVCKTV